MLVCICIAYLCGVCPPGGCGVRRVECARPVGVPWRGGRWPGARGGCAPGRAAPRRGGGRRGPAGARCLMRRVPLLRRVQGPPRYREEPTRPRRRGLGGVHLAIPAEQPWALCLGPHSAQWGGAWAAVAGVGRGCAVSMNCYVVPAFGALHDGPSPKGGKRLPKATKLIYYKSIQKANFHFFLLPFVGRAPLAGTARNTDVLRAPGTQQPQAAFLGCTPRVQAISSFHGGCKSDARRAKRRGGRLGAASEQGASGAQPPV